MHEIRLLSPRGLWALAPLRALIEALLVVMKSEHGGHYAPLYARMLAQQQIRLREKIRENLNMRIKAWILHCPARIAWVRGIIGEAAIKHWRKNRLADYALRKYFGDWKRKFPHGFKHIQKRRVQKFTPIFKPAFWHAARPYIWKAFALVKIINVCGFLYGRPTQKTAPTIGTENAPNWTQPRGARTLKPIRFTPNELAIEAAAESEESGAERRIEQARTYAMPDDQAPLGTSVLLTLDTKPP